MCSCITRIRRGDCCSKQGGRWHGTVISPLRLRIARRAVTACRCSAGNRCTTHSAPFLKPARVKRCMWVTTGNTRGRNCGLSSRKPVSVFSSVERPKKGCGRGGLLCAEMPAIAGSRPSGVTGIALRRKPWGLSGVFFLCHSAGYFGPWVRRSSPDGRGPARRKLYLQDLLDE